MIGLLNPPVQLSSNRSCLFICRIQLRDHRTLNVDPGSSLSNIDRFKSKACQISKKIRESRQKAQSKTQYTRTIRVSSKGNASRKGVLPAEHFKCQDRFQCQRRTKKIRRQEKPSKNRIVEEDKESKECQSKSRKERNDAIFGQRIKDTKVLTRTRKKTLMMQ